MSQVTYQLLWVDQLDHPSITESQNHVLNAGKHGDFAIEKVHSLETAAQMLGQRAFQVVLLCLSNEQARVLSLWSGLSHAIQEAAVVVLTQDCPHEWMLELLRKGVQEVLPLAALREPEAQALIRALYAGIERRKLEREARRAFATDLSTGLPNRTQLIEHMSHLLALRQREPAPMSLLVLRVEGLPKAVAEHGREAANVLRRKVAVRIRAAMRSSDVVASLGDDVFAVLLASIEKSEHTERVVQKLHTHLHRPFSVAGQQLAVACSIGQALHPADAGDADTLLRIASAAAAAQQASGRAGYANWHEQNARDRRGTKAANDDEETS